MQIKSFCLFLYCLHTAIQLSCTIYDYTSSIVKCVTNCPTNTSLIQNKCLQSDQYITSDNQVHICLGYVSSDHLLCCNLGTFSLNKGFYVFNGTCLKCNGNMYVNSSLCCSYDQYIDFTTNPQSCEKINQGSCPLISLKQQFKVCCPSNLFYNINTKTCTSSSGSNCDQINKICCPLNQKLQYITQTDSFVCVQNCNWIVSSSSSFYCQLIYCNQNLQVQTSSPSLSLLYKNTAFNQSNRLLVYYNNGQCCYGFSSSNVCYLNQIDCGQRFMNRGWSICCPSYYFYNFTTKNCMTACNGYILFQFLCISNSSYLDLTGTIPNQTVNSICNNKTLLKNQPYCCPANFYINGNMGCTLCHGNIYQNGAQQICCPKNYYFVLGQGCLYCQGHLDASGMICCFANQYIRYTSSGNATCVSSCAVDNIYNTEYCCDSLTNLSCNIAGYQSTTCSIQYYVSNVCQGCPTFCSNINTCTLSTSQTCTQICSQNTVYYNPLNSCLSCDSSCIGCSIPFSNAFCSTCAIGYTNIGGSCIKCNANCSSCLGSSSNCTSCQQNSQNTYLSNGSCLRICQQSFYPIDSTFQCSPCNFTCVQCIGSTSNDCTKCQTGYYLNFKTKGSCIQCSSQCAQCFGSSSNCSKCQNGLFLNIQTNSCISNCLGNQISLSWLGLNTCISCHPQCATCKNTPQNCLTCFYNTQYLNQSFGVSVCSNCISPCNFCSSYQNCTSCIDGFYFKNSTLKCLPCYSQCKTCYGELSNNCLTCFGDSILSAGQCTGCSASCKTCDTNKNCLQCKSSYYLYQSGCVVNCPNGTYGTNNSTCNACYSQCLTCTNGSSNGCLTCNSSNFLVNGSCVGCSSNCKVCNSNNICTSCNGNYFLYQDNCINSCPNGTYQNSGVCSSCPSTCKICINISYCTECNPQNPILFNNLCSSTCPSGYYVNGTTCTYNETNNNTNNTNNNSSNLSQIIDQSIILQNGILFINLYFSSNTSVSQIAQFTNVYLVDQDTSQKLKLNTSVIKIDQNNKKLILQATLPAQAVNYQLTSSSVQQNSTLKSNSYVSSKVYSQLLINSFEVNSISNIKYIGIFMSGIIFLACIFAKGKDHFIAQQANTLILKVLNFVQIIYFFTFINIQQTELHNFFDGFGFANINFFPNFFSSTLPSDYIQSPVQRSLNPDGNIIRNAGFTFSFQLIVLGTLLILSGLSYLYFLKENSYQMPYIRKIMRITTFLFFLGYINQLFFAWTELIQPATIQNQYISIYHKSVAVAITIVFLIPLLMITVIYHFYATYNSDVLQHYYTLRQGSLYALIFFQSIVLAFSVGKPLVSLFLIPLEIIWIIYGYILYKYGEGYTISDYLKFIICGSTICIGILCLALNQHLNQILVIIIIVLVLCLLLIYVFYQVIGLYYYQIFGKMHQK